MEVLQNLLELLSSMAEEPIDAPSPATIPNLERSQAQRNSLREEVHRSPERLSAHKSKSHLELSTVKVTAAELKTSLDTSAASVRCLEGKLARLKAAQADASRYVTCLSTTDCFE